MGGRPGRGRCRQDASPAVAIAPASAAGRVRVGAATPWVSSSCVTNSRNTTGSPSVTKYASPGRPRLTPSNSPSTVLSTCVIEVRWPPPPIHAKRPARTSSTIEGSRVVSPLPHTKRGRTTTVSKPSRLAARTACSARALVALYRAGESGRRGAVSSISTRGRPAINAASVPTCTKRRTPASAQARRAFSVPRTLPRSNSSGSPQSPSIAAA
ncbi:MAG TPA: hypothetical protein VMI13_03285 [Solirubrobacteraceae bacterium]|nr:hypothetical protein [Solirubrobacteraceae bacterium]